MSSDEDRTKCSQLRYFHAAGRSTLQRSLEAFISSSQLQNPAAGPLVLVTGAHRSGTTWVGEILSASCRMGKTSEPFNRDFGALEVPYWYFRVPVAESELWRRKMAAYLGQMWSLTLVSSLEGGVHSVLKAAKNGGYLRSPWHGLVVKDPLMLLSAEWFAFGFDAVPVVLIRHPAAFAGSLKKWGWSFPFGDLLEQSSLWDGELGAFEDDVARFAREERTIVEQAALLWRILYTMVAHYRERHPHWVFVRHEDLVHEPRRGFADLFDRLGLPFGSAAQRRIDALSAGRSENDRTDPHALKRDPERVIRSWRRRLTEQEVTGVRERTSDVWPRFYAAETWEA